MGIRSLNFGPVDVRIAVISDCSFDPAAMLEVLSVLERGRAGRFKFERDRERYIWRQAMLRFALAERLGCEARAIECTVSEHGKPCLGGRLAGASLRFNLSHSDGLIAIALAEGLEVGVDVERVRPMTDLSALAERCLSTAERDRFRRVEPENATDVFIGYWTRKEAVLKAMGTGLSVEPDRLSVGEVPMEEGALETVVIDPFGVSWRVWSFRPAVGWWGAVACEEGRRE